MFNIPILSLLLTPHVVAHVQYKGASVPGYGFVCHSGRRIERGQDGWLLEWQQGHDGAIVEVSRFGQVTDTTKDVDPAEIARLALYSMCHFECVPVFVHTGAVS